MRHVLSTVLLLAAQAAFAAPPVVTAPPKVYGEVGDWVEITVKVDGAKAVRFVPLDPSLRIFPPGKLKDELTTWVRATEAKTFSILVYAGNADGASEPVFVEAVFIGNPVIPPGPGPGPDPQPKPVDANTKALADAYGAENAVDKRERVRALAGAMRDAAKLATDSAIATNGVLAARVAKLTDDKVDGYLIGVRKEIGKQLKAEFPTESVALTPELRAKFQAAYTRIAQALDGIGQ